MSEILVVDDQVETCNVLSRILQKIGYSTECAYGGEEALSKLQNQPRRLVILDYMMPDLDGIEVLRRIRSNPQTSGLPVVIYTALDDPTFHNYARSMGANAIWVKADSGGISHLRQQVANLLGN